jgi:adenylate kinase family enzyme
VSVRPRDGSARLVEVLGLPGTGKTTVVRALASHDGIEVRSRYRSLDNAPAYAAAAVRCAPMLFASPPAWPDRNRIVRAESSWAIARRAFRGRTDALVFDQGPLFLLKQVSETARRSRAIAVWRADRLRRWGRTLDLVVLLDAPNDVLVRRIHDRPKDHVLRDIPEDVAVRALDADRRSFDALLADLSRGGPVRIERLDTSAAPVEATVDATLRRISTFAGT